MEKEKSKSTEKDGPWGCATSICQNCPQAGNGLTLGDYTSPWYNAGSNDYVITSLPFASSSTLGRLDNPPGEVVQLFTPNAAWHWWQLPLVSFKDGCKFRVKFVWAQIVKPLSIPEKALVFVSVSSSFYQLKLGRLRILWSRWMESQRIGVESLRLEAAGRCWSLEGWAFDFENGLSVLKSQLRVNF